MTASATLSAVRSWRRILDDPSPLVRQSPTALALVVAAALVAFIPALGFTDPIMTVVGCAFIAAATAYAAVLTARRQHEGLLVLMIPVVDIIGLGLFRAGTGGAQSLFGSLVLLPVVWLAAAPGLRYVFLVGGLTSFAMLTPYFADPPERAVDWLRGVISPLVFAGVAGVVNELSRQHRLRVAQAETLVAERTEALAETRRTVESLREAEREYRALLDSFQSLWGSITAQAVIAVDPRGVILEWNPGAERLLEMPLTAALSDVRFDRFLPADVLHSLSEEAGVGSAIMHAEETDSDGLGVLLARADSDCAESDLEVITANGTRITARITVSRRLRSRSSPPGYILVVTDESRAAEVARMKDEFIGMISHELRTPLSSIIGFLDLLRNDPEEPLTEEQSDFVDIIERNAQRLLGLVGDLLFTAQVESGSFSLSTHERDVGAIVTAAVASAGPNAARQGITLSADLPAESVSAAVDERRLGQALDNLLSNAIKFTPTGGTVSVAVRAIDESVSLSVRDTGIGIPKDEQGMLFTRFFRASTATRNAVPGVGLGLTITRAITVAHGGTLDVISEVGEGTEFRMVLPLTT